MINEPEARVIAERVLDSKVRPRIGEEVVVLRAIEYATCWAVIYNSAAYARSGSLSDALVGNGPVIINKQTGQARLASSALPLERQLDPA